MIEIGTAQASADKPVITTADIRGDNRSLISPERDSLVDVTLK